MDIPGGLVETFAPALREGHRGVPTRQFLSRKSPDYAERDKRNRELGLFAERLVKAHEIQTLLEAKRRDLADLVSHVSEAEGDGAGYDILSFDIHGNKKFIEVKATKGSISTDFYMTINEMVFAQEHPENYFLYRLYECDMGSNGAKFFIVNGKLESRFVFTPINYKVKLA